MHLFPILARAAAMLALSVATVACAAPVPLPSSVPAAAVPVDPSATAAKIAPELIDAEDIRADFATLYQQLQDAHYDLFVHRPKAEYDVLFHQMHAGFVVPMPLDEVRRRFQRFVAYGNVAHASVAATGGDWERFRAGGGRAFPLFLRVVDGKVHVADDYSGVPAITQGVEVLAIDGQPALNWLQRLREQVSADNDRLAHAQMEARLPLLVWEEYGEVDAYQLDIAGADGQSLRVTVPARDRAGFEAASTQRPQRFELDWNTREARMLDGGIAYLRPGPFYDNRPEVDHPWDPVAFRQFIDEAFSGFIAAGADTLLIDLRNNPGGDNSFSDLLVAWVADKPFRFSPAFDIRISEAAIASNRQRLQASGGGADSTSAALAAAYEGQPLRGRIDFPIPLVAPRDGERFTGRVHVLVNRHSYSNAVSVAAIVQDYGFGKVIGEETADLASTYGAMEKFVLPLTGIEVGFPKAHILRPNGDPRPRGVIPDTTIESPLTASGEDVVLQRALAAIRRGSPD